jgi:hypothetical protein
MRAEGKCGDKLAHVIVVRFANLTLIPISNEMAKLFPALADLRETAHAKQIRKRKEPT